MALAWLRTGLAVLAAGILTFVVHCEKKTASPVIARVGSAVLTLDDLYESIPQQYRGRITREQHMSFVKQWIDSELLFQEALRRKIHKDRPIRDRLGKMKRDLLCAEVISRSSRLSRSVEIPEEAVREYYEKNRETFIRRQDVVRYIELVVEDLKTAWQVRNMVSSDNFLDLAAKYSTYPVPDPRSVPFVPIDRLSPEIAQTVANIRMNGTSSPMKTGEGYSIFRILDKQAKGTICGVDEVRDEVVSRLSSRAHKAEIEKLMVELRRNMDVEFDLGVIPEHYPSEVDADKEAEVR